MHRIAALIFLLFANVAQAQTYVQQGGSAGHNYGSSLCPVAGSVLVCTIPANPQRFSVTVQDQGGIPVYVCLSNGALVGLNVYNGTNEGTLWSSLTYKGQVKAYGATGSVQVACWDE